MADATNMTPDWIASHLGKIPCTVLPDGNLRTCPVRLSFPHLFKPQKALEEGKADKFTATFLFPEGADLTLLKQKAADKAKEKWPDAGTPSGPSLKSPFRDQADKQKFDGYVAGRTFITATAENRVPLMMPNGAPITDESKLYAGCWVLGLIRPFFYDQKVNKGVSFGLQGVIFIADDQNLGGGGVDTQAAVAGLEISQDVNPASLF